MADANLKGWSQAVTLTPASCAFIGPQPMSAASATPAAMAKAKPAGRQHGVTAIALRWTSGATGSAASRRTRGDGSRLDSLG